MKMLIIGGSQGTGALAVREALKRGHQVTCFARHPEKLPVEDGRLGRIAGDFHDKKSVGPAVKDHDVVIITASSNSLQGFKNNPNYFSIGTAHVIEAMKTEGVRRLVVLSAFGVGDSRPLAGFLADKLLISLILKLPFQDHERQEAMVRASALDWVIARPTRLTNGPARGQYEAKTKLEKVPSAISRADVADFLINAAESDKWMKVAVQLGG